VEATRYAFGGIVVSERFSTYNYFPVKQRQLCRAHVIRDFTAIAERPAAPPTMPT
jgi:transposase